MPFKLVGYKDVTSNCLSVKLESASNQELEIAFAYNPKNEAEKIIILPVMGVKTK